MSEVAAWLIVLFPSVATLVLLVELAAGQFRPPPLFFGGAPRIAVLLPARDEQASIGATVESLQAQGPSNMRLLVIADNCVDETAATARAAGADVVERNDPGRVGKGYALAAGRDRLSEDPPDVVVLVDADCTVAGDGIAQLAAAAFTRGCPIQSTYLMRPRPEAGAIVAFSGFAFLIRNLVRQRGLARLGAPALVTGSGIALPWRLFASAPLASSDLVEDLSLGVALARAGHSPMFLPEVQTWSDPPPRMGLRAQRSRWEHGFLSTAFRHGWWLLADARRWPLFWLALHLTVPPLALLAFVDGAVLLLLGVLAAAGATWLPMKILLLLTGLLLALLALSWLRFGRDQIRAWQLLLLPAYLLWKLPVYAAALLRPQRTWVRTSRP